MIVLFYPEHFLIQYFAKIVKKAGFLPHCIVKSMTFLIGQDHLVSFEYRNSIVYTGEHQRNCREIA